MAAAAIQFAAWLMDLLFGFLTSATKGWLFVISPTFRRQAFARWSRQSQGKTLGEISEGAFGVAGTLALIGATILILTILTRAII